VIERDRGPCDVAQQTFTSLVIARADHHAGVQVEALDLRRLRV